MLFRSLAMDVKGPKLCVLSSRPQTARLGWGLGTKCPILGHFVPEPSLGVRITKIDLNLCDWYPNAFFMVFEAFGTHLKLFSPTPRSFFMMVPKCPFVDIWTPIKITPDGPSDWIRIQPRMFLFGHGYQRAKTVRFEPKAANGTLGVGVRYKMSHFGTFCT